MNRITILLALALALVGCNKGENTVSENTAPTAPPKAETLPAADLAKVTAEVWECWASGVYTNPNAPTTGNNVANYIVYYTIKNNSRVPIKGARVHFTITLPGTDYKQEMDQEVGLTKFVQGSFRSMNGVTEGLLLPGHMTDTLSFYVQGIDRKLLGLKMVAQATVTEAIPLKVTDDYTDQDQVSWLFYEGNMDRIKTALKNMPQIVDAKTAMTLKPIHYAVLQKNIEVVRLLEQNGADINDFTDARENALHFAAMSTPEMVEYVRSRGVKPLPENTEGENALHYAVYVDNGAVIKALLRAGVSLTEKDWEGNSAAMAAIRYRRIGMLRQLAAAGANLKTDHTPTIGPIGMAIFSKSVPTLEEVAKLRGSIAEVGQNGMTPLHRAVKYADLDMVEWLVAHGAKANVKDANQETPKDLVAQLPYQVVADKIFEVLEKAP